MSPVDAALGAMYPVMAILGGIIWLRFLPTLHSLETGIRALVCSMLVIVAGIVLEQLIYGFGRFYGSYIQIATSPPLVVLGKLLYIVGFSYMLYAFWLIAPAKPRIVVTFGVSFIIWLGVFSALLA